MWAEVLLVGNIVQDILLPSKRRQCNICGWDGREFYPNVGPGYNERKTLCPGCGGLARHRSLMTVLEKDLGVFDTPGRIIEVAPMRGMHETFVNAPGLEYTSIDLERFAMERGDVTQMRFGDNEADLFICFHVLEHIADEAAAVREISRVLRPGGVLVAQVPIDWSITQTYEYDAPDPREVGHVRRYGSDFAERMASYGFAPRAVRALDFVDAHECERLRLSGEPIYILTKGL